MFLRPVPASSLTQQLHMYSQLKDGIIWGGREAVVASESFVHTKVTSYVQSKFCFKAGRREIISSVLFQCRLQPLPPLTQRE